MSHPGGPASRPRLTVDAERLRDDLETLGKIGRAPAAGITRTSFSGSDMQAREWYQASCRAAGLTVCVDAVGNMFADTGSGADVAAVWSGSHIDTVPDGGAFDGAVGAVAALECVRRIAEEGISLNRPVRAVVFADEEGNYSHLFGSSALTRGFDEEQLRAMVGRDGDHLVDAMTAGGWDLGAITGARIDPESVYAFVELHIEQGPRLEGSSHPDRRCHLDRWPRRRSRRVLRPCRPRRHHTHDRAAGSVAGRGGPDSRHAGHRRCRQRCSRRDLRGVDTAPGSANVVPSLARLTLDYRDPDAARLGTLGARLEAKAAQAAGGHGIRYVWIADLPIAPTELNPRIRSAIERHADSLALSTLAMPSGAGHDSQNMATIAPTGMIFVPSKGGAAIALMRTPTGVT